MLTSMIRRSRSLTAGALIFGTAISLTACGEQRGSGTAAGAPSAASSAASGARSGPGSGSGPGNSAAPGSRTGPGSTADPGSSSSGPASGAPSVGASPYVEPGAGDGAPHYRENNAHRFPRDMSPAGAKDAKREADRIEPVLKRLWEQKKWDPESVRAAMLALGYEEERTGPKGEQLGGTLSVQGMRPRFETDHYVTPEGARIGLRVHPDACVTAFVQKTDYEVQTNGPYLESGCFEPPFGH
ncbi:hypothetical protein Q3V23_02610 [Streptomyces sp. VNUA116]|uniref:hypothetical protein n=1 Tax=Streptomyces sp. VNUA116 TaxID=3062449 RepID=UPI002674D044|nr:hypothetical protein [Streptomyces sp. VNUA116]WKU43051.1 hypothetical protein Q3V23_02610 [Streptomyces sp. VNUA116]